MWERICERLKRLTIFDLIVWVLFALWCFVKSPALHRHILMIHNSNVKTSDLAWNIANDLIAFVAALGVAILLARVLRWVNKKVK